MPRAAEAFAVRPVAAAALHAASAVELRAGRKRRDASGQTGLPHLAAPVQHLLTKGIIIKPADRRNEKFPTIGKLATVLHMNIEPVGIIHSCYKEKFGIPRQAGLVKSATATLELLAPYNIEETLRGIEEFSHLWIVFVFHKHLGETFQPTVRPPRLGGNARKGVFATRSPFRPSGIGLSVVELKGVTGTVLELGGGDFLDGTPVLDIKPYIPYADSIPEATGGFALAAPEAALSVGFSPEAENVFQTLEKDQQQLIRDMLSHDPRPAYQADDPDRIFGTRVFDLDLKWKQEKNSVIVVSIQPA